MIPSPHPGQPKSNGPPPFLWDDEFPVDEPERERMPDEAPLPNPDENREPARYCLAARIPH